jgi:hypothetical protein
MKPPAGFTTMHATFVIRSSEARRQSRAVPQTLDCFASLAMTNRSRSASRRPRRWSVSHVNRRHRFYSVLHAKRLRANAGGSIWKASLGTDDERKERKKNIGGETPTDAMKYLPWQRPRPRLCAERRTSIGVPPRFSPQGVFHRKGLSLRPGFLGRGGTRFAHPLSGRYPPLPVPVQRQHLAP